MTRFKVELSHKITVLSNWAFNDSKDTISLLSEKQAKEIVELINQIWTVAERRNNLRKPNR